MNVEQGHYKKDIFFHQYAPSFIVAPSSCFFLKNNKFLQFMFSHIIMTVIDYWQGTLQSGKLLDSKVPILFLLM